MPRSYAFRRDVETRERMAERNMMIYSPSMISCDQCEESFDERLAEKVEREGKDDLRVCPDCFDSGEEEG